MKPLFQFSWLSKVGEYLQQMEHYHHRKLARAEPELKCSAAVRNLIAQLTNDVI